MANELEYVEANGLRFAYLSEGKGPLVLMFHGFPDTARSWDHARPRIAAAGFRVVTPWLRGYQPTAIPERDTDLVTSSRDILELIPALGEKTAIVIGHDFGAAAGYGAAVLGPDRISKLITIAIPHPLTLKPTPRKLWLARHFLAYKLPGAAQRFAAHDFAALPAIYKRWSPAWSPPPDEFTAVRQTFANPASLDAAFGYYRALKILPQAWLEPPITMPTVSFAGLDDPFLTPAEYRRGERMFAAGYTVEEMRGGHFMHREHPEEFLDKLLPHLAA